MMFIKKIAILTFLFLAFSLSSFAQTETRASVVWKVLKYDITANVPQNPSDRYLTAKATLILQNAGSAAGSRVTFRINDKAEILSVTVNNSTATIGKSESEKGLGRDIKRFGVSVSSVQPSANVTVSIDYKIKVDENSGLNSISPVGSQFLPLSFWYPTPNSHYASYGADYAPFTLRVTSSNEKVVSSGNQSGTMFEQKVNGQPFFLTGSWDLVDAKGVSIYLPKGAGDFEKQRANELASLAVEANTFTASLLGSGTSVPLKIVAVRRGSGFSDAGTILLDNAVFRRQKVDSQTAMTIAESVAKIWLGNTKLVRGEGYGVIREGLARYIATKFIEKQFGKDAAENERLRQRAAYALIAQNELPFLQSSPLYPSYYSSVANRGAMIWNDIAKSMSQEQLFSYLKTQNEFTLLGIRTTFSDLYPLLENSLTQANETNLLVGLPQGNKVAVRNTGNFNVNVNVQATTDKGEKLIEKVLISPKSFGEVIFKTTSKIVRTEIDPEKIYPQTDYSDDVAPREFTESNPLLVVKRAFDKQEAREFVNAEKYARLILQTNPHFDEARMWLGRALLAQNKLAEAEKEFQAALNEKLPSPQTLGWANVGLGEIALKSNRLTDAAKFFDEAIKSDAESSATYTARLNRRKVNQPEIIDETVRAFFTQFDKAAVGGRKADLEALAVMGEKPAFIRGIGGQAEQWQTKIVRVDKIDANNALVEADVSIKLLNTQPQTGTAIYYLSKVGGIWKLSGVNFEVN